jgi:hypothetical protein
MTKYLVVIILLCSCAENRTAPEGKAIHKDSVKTTEFKPVIHYDRLKNYFLSADSVVLFSHHSPNEPIKNPSTGKYYRHTIPFIEKWEDKLCNECPGAKAIK